MSYPDFLSSRVSIGVIHAVKAIAVYGVVACLTAGFFFLSHHAGNQTPYALVVERLATEFEAEPHAWGIRNFDFYNQFDYCLISGAVLAGASPVDRQPLRDALFPKQIKGQETIWCDEFAVRYNGDAMEFVPLDAEDWQLVLPTRYWWGSKAVYAIALRYLSVIDYHELVRRACYAAYGLLAVALLLLGWRAFAVASPVLLFGVTLSGIEYFFDLVNGLPYAWAVFAPAVLALLLRADANRKVVRLYCFFAGMVQGYLWLLEGNNFIATALICLVVWLGGGDVTWRAKVARSVCCALMHVGGFVVCLTLGVVAKSAVQNSMFPGSAPMVMERTLDVVARRGMRVLFPEDRDLLGRQLGTWADLLPVGVPAIDALAMFSVLALLAAIGIGIYHAHRGNAEPLAGALLMVGLLVGVCIHFILPSDPHHRAARLMWLPLALCWSCLLFVLVRVPRPAFHALAFVVVSSVMVLSCDLWRHVRTKAAMAALAPSDRIITDKYDVYRKGRRLFYVKDECGGRDMRRRFILNIHPVNVEDLEPHDQQRGFEIRDFYFARHRLFSFGASCQGVVELPQYAIAQIRTGQHCCYEGYWEATVAVTDD